MPDADLRCNCPIIDHAFVPRDHMPILSCVVFITHNHIALPYVPPEPTSRERRFRHTHPQGSS